MVTVMTSRDFNQRTSAAKVASLNGPVFVTDRGQPRHVLLTYDLYERLAGRQTLGDAAAQWPDTSAVEVDFPRSGELPRAAVFD